MGWTREERHHLNTTIACRTCGELFDVSIGGLDETAYERRLKEAVTERNLLRRSWRRYSLAEWLRLRRRFSRRRLERECQYGPDPVCPKDDAHPVEIWNGLAVPRPPDHSAGPFLDHILSLDLPFPPPGTPAPRCPRCDGTITLVRVGLISME